MIKVLRWLGMLISAAVRRRRDLALENLALRLQLAELSRLLKNGQKKGTAFNGVLFSNLFENRP